MNIIIQSLKMLLIPFPIFLIFQCSPSDQNSKNSDKTEYIDFLEISHSKSKILSKRMGDDLRKFVPENSQDLPDKLPLKIEFITTILPSMQSMSNILLDIRFALIMDQYGSFDDINKNISEQYIGNKVELLKNGRESLKQASEAMAPFTNQDDYKKVIDDNSEMILLIENVVLKLSELKWLPLLNSK